MRMLAAFMGLLICLEAVAQPSTQPADEDFVISPSRQQQTRPATLFYRELEASFATFNEVARPVHEALPAILRESGNRAAGPEMIVYFGLPADRETRFKFHFGMIVEEGANPHGEFKVRELPAIKCRSILYSGHVRNLPRAFRQLMQELESAGEQTTGEIRELSLHWEGEDSPNNVVQLQVGLK